MHATPLGPILRKQSAGRARHACPQLHAGAGENRVKSADSARVSSAVSYQKQSVLRSHAQVKVVSVECLEFKWSRPQALTALEWHTVLMARESVFVVEQRCPYQEADHLDAHAWHLQVRKDGQLAAYARVVDAGCKYPAPSIGRVMTLPAFRGQQLGRALMQEAIRFTQQHNPHAGIQISAQAYLQHFYAALGFVAEGAGYDEDGIPHIGMVMPARQAVLP